MTVVVTGASSGLGREICKSLKETHDVTPMGLAREDGEHVHYRVDITDRKQVREALQGRDSVWGVVNCAGINLLQPFEELNVTEAKRVMDVNLWGGVNVTLEALPALKKHAGVVCNIISSAADTPMTHSLAYNASKAAAKMMTRQLARELAPHRITVFGVSPIKIAGTGMSEYIDNAVPALRGWTKEEARAYQLKALLTGEADKVRLGGWVAELVLRAKSDPMLSGTVINYGA